MVSVADRQEVVCDLLHLKKLPGAGCSTPQDQLVADLLQQMQAPPSDRVQQPLVRIVFDVDQVDDGLPQGMLGHVELGDPGQRAAAEIARIFTGTRYIRILIAQ